MFLFNFSFQVVSTKLSFVYMLVEIYKKKKKKLILTLNLSHCVNYIIRRSMKQTIEL